MKGRKFFLSAALVLLFFACNGNKKISEPKTVTASLGAEPTILDAAKASDRYSFMILDYINENLTDILTEDNGEIKILPALAESLNCVKPIGLTA